MEHPYTGAFRLTVPACFFVAKQGSFSCTVVDASLPGSRHPDSTAQQNAFDWALFEALEPSNRFRFDTEWVWSSIEFAKKLSNSELHDILSYVHDGDMFVNAFLMHREGLLRTPNPCPGSKLAGNWFLKQHVWGESTHLLFAQQARRMFPDTGLDSDVGAADKISQYDAAQWSQVLTAYCKDLAGIIRKSPRLQQPMVVYRGEPGRVKWCPYKNVPLERACSARFISCTLDASSAAFFARQHSHTKQITNIGRVYRILLPKDTPVAFLAGMQTWTGVFECECLLPPMSFMHVTGRRTLHMPGGSIEVVDVDAGTPNWGLLDS